MKQRLVNALFPPRSVVVGGASAVPGEMGDLVLSSLVAAEYGSRIFPVNPEGGPELPGDLDLAVFVLERGELLPAFEDLARRGWKAAVVRAPDSETPFRLAGAFAALPPSRGPNWTVASNAGGPGVPAAGACKRSSLHMARLSPETIRRLQAFFPPCRAAFCNSVDVSGSVDRLGCPIARKSASPQMARATDADDVRREFSAMTGRLRRLHPEAQASGCFERMEPSAGRENVRAGFRRDAQFGPLRAFGFSGFRSAIVGDVARRLTLLSRAEAFGMIRSIAPAPFGRAWTANPASTSALRRTFCSPLPRLPRGPRRFTGRNPIPFGRIPSWPKWPRPGLPRGRDAASRRKS